MTWGTAERKKKQKSQEKKQLMDLHFGKFMEQKWGQMFAIQAFGLYIRISLQDCI